MLTDQLSGVLLMILSLALYLSSSEESELEWYLIQASSDGYGKTRSQIKAIAENVDTIKGVLCQSHISNR